MSDNLVSIVLDENVIALWHLELDGGNFLGALRQQPTEGMEFTFRFRYYRDDKLGPDSQDEKHWYRSNINNWSQAQAVNKLREVYKKVARSTNSSLNEILMDETGVDGFVAKMEKFLPISSHPMKAYPPSIQQACCAQYEESCAKAGVV
jgi:hypothetical protein